jgi:NAD(P)-dependent dehydrogenase (short-subunit alcohol dehydrogenase family)
MILIVGGARYIGSHTNKMLNRNGYRTVVFDNLRSGHREFVKWGVCAAPACEAPRRLAKQELLRVSLLRPLGGCRNLACARTSALAPQETARVGAGSPFWRWCVRPLAARGSKGTLLALISRPNSSVRCRREGAVE